MTLENILPRATPESQGVDSSNLLAFVNELDQTINEVHSLMLLRHGRVIAEGWWSPYAPNLPHTLFSLSKSFTSSAVDWQRRKAPAGRPGAFSSQQKPPRIPAIT
jgi:hypothetical protein